ncbi:MAG: rod shape-determining protein MreC [Clostridia bacterium]|nr:rod shape-determining protein MreC [Clostridia bacterium]
MNKNNNASGIFGIVITIFLLIILVIFSNVNIEKFSYIEGAISKIVTPIQNGMIYLKNKINGNESFFTDIANLKKENENLKAKISELEQEQRELEIIKAENTTLKDYMNLTEKYAGYKTLPAYIIGKDISNYSKTIIINLGKKDGIEVNMTVIADAGLVGHVISVTDETAKVETIIDSASSVSSNITTTREAIICRGVIDSNNLRAVNIPTDTNLVSGDNVETSGMGGIYPKGILIGTIKDIINTRNIMDRYAVIKPAVDFEKLETVLVITNK